MADGALQSLSSAARHALLKGVLSARLSRRYRRLVEAARRPREVQAALLERIVRDNADTEFGRGHGFSRAGSPAAYREAVPVQTYEDLRPLIERQELTGERCLTMEPPVYYHRTSGTVGAAKNIPVTASGLKRMKQDQRVAAYVWSRSSGILKGKAFAVTGQAVEGRMEGGSPYGSASGLLYQGQSRLVRSQYVLPAETADIEDYEARYVAMAVYGLSEEGVTGVATANPSTFLRLLTVAEEHAQVVLEAIASGRMPAGASYPAPVERGLKPRPARAEYLAERLRARGRFSYADIWPRLTGMVTWTGGSCGTALHGLSGLLPPDTAIIELGYLASEFRGTLNIDARNNVCLPNLFQTYFEFVERGAWEAGEAGDAAFAGLHELEHGGEYYVFVTTLDGLYRYDMNDIVRVNGRVHETPTLEFVQKGKGTTSITGEKLTESQVLSAAPAVLSLRGVGQRFFIVIADEEAAAYTMFVEADRHEDGEGIAREVDAWLSKLNVEYEAKRKSGRLAPLRLRWLRRGAGDEYRATCVATGQRDAQFKYLHLQYARECKLDFTLSAVE